MASLKKGKLRRSEKKIALRDEHDIKKETAQLIRETRKDMFNPARMTTRHIDQHLQETDQMLAALERLRGNVRQGYIDYHEVKTAKAMLKTNKKRLSLAKKAKKIGAKNAEISNALRSDDKQHTHRHVISLIKNKIQSVKSKT